MKILNSEEELIKKAYIDYTNRGGTYSFNIFSNRIKDSKTKQYNYCCTCVYDNFNRCDRPLNLKKPCVEGNNLFLEKYNLK